MLNCRPVENVCLSVCQCVCLPALCLSACLSVCCFRSPVCPSWRHSYDVTDAGLYLNDFVFSCRGGMGGQNPRRVWHHWCGCVLKVLVFSSGERCSERVLVRYGVMTSLTRVFTWRFLSFFLCSVVVCCPACRAVRAIWVSLIFATIYLYFTCQFDNFLRSSYKYMFSPYKLHKDRNQCYRGLGLQSAFAHFCERNAYDVFEILKKHKYVIKKHIFWQVNDVPSTTLACAIYRHFILFQTLALQNIKI